ncbi:MAG: VOC family protein [Gaiella sp.]|nr:VOC family protein [Gaiella sp.]
MPAPTLVTGAPCWIDLYSSDTDKAIAFYRELFGWSAEPPQEEFGGYFTFTKDGKHVAGCMRNDGEYGLPDSWGVHLMTGDVETVAAAAPKSGGSVEFGPMVVGENGTSAMLRDPGGAGVGAWQPNQQKGFEVTGEIGTPAWFELHTRAYEPTVAFYRDVFGWDTHVMSDTDEFRYTTLGEGEGQLAGIMDDSPHPGDEPAHWAVYFAVADADAAIERVIELGGSVVRPAEDTPYGRLATVTDATGTQLRIVADAG